MPRGKYVNHKGRSRNFTSPEELEEERKKDKKKASQPEAESESESEEEEASGSNSESGSGSEDSDDDNQKAKGVSSLIEIENPNRVQRKSAVKVTKIGEKPPKAELSRREREELEKQRAQAAYQKLHAEGKTDQARADLARLAIIKQHRAEAAARREAEKKEKDVKKDKDDRKKPTASR